MNASTLSVTGLVTPFSVRSPFTATSLSPSNLKSLPLKVAVGILLDLEEIRGAQVVGELRRRPVLIAVMSIVMSALPFFAARSSVILPVALVNMPRCVDIPKCFTSNVGKVWRASTV